MGRKVIREIVQKYRKRKLRSCGVNSYIAKNCSLQGNIYVGAHVVLGVESYFVSTRASLYIHDHVIFGPNVTIYTGDHPMDVVGKHISELTDADKKDASLDRDVIIESGCWIGTRAIILKGVTIGRGSIIGAGAIVTKDVPPYSIYVGVPASRTIARFEKEQILQHEMMLRERGLLPDKMTISR